MEYMIVIGFIVSSVLLLLLIVLLIKSVLLKVNIVWLFLGIACSSLGNFFSLTSSAILHMQGQILLGLGFLFIFFHYESIVSRRPHLWMTLVLVTLVAVASCFSLVSVVFIIEYPDLFDFSSGNIVDYLSIQEPIFHFAYLVRINTITILALLVFSRCLYIIYKSYKNSLNKSALIESIGLIFLILYRLLFIPINFLNTDFIPILLSVALFFSIFGILIIIINYLLHPDYLYYLPFPIHSFMVYNFNGILCYSRNVKSESLDIEDKNVLMSGALSAISSLIHETLGTNANIQHIDAQEFQIFFNSLPQDSGKLVVISYGDTALFSRSLERFVSLIPTNVLKDLNEDFTSRELEESIDRLIQKSFPYVGFTK